MASYIPEYRCTLVRDGTTRAPSPVADCPARVNEIVRAYWGPGELDREHLIALLLNARSKVIGITTVSIGTLSGAMVHPREVFKPAIIAGAAAVVVVHNHPSGDPAPSPDDRETTRRLTKAGEIIGIPLLDHVIIAAEGTYSFREMGLLS